MTDAALRRLRAYCTRAGRSFEDWEPTPAGPDPFTLASRDVEVRDALVAATANRTEWDLLLAAVGREHGFALLDLVAETAKARPAHASTLDS